MEMREGGRRRRGCFLVRPSRISSQAGSRGKERGGAQAARLGQLLGRRVLHHRDSDMLRLFEPPAGGGGGGVVSYDDFLREGRRWFLVLETDANAAAAAAAASTTAAAAAAAATIISKMMIEG